MTQLIESELVQGPRVRILSCQSRRGSTLYGADIPLDRAPFPDLVTFQETVDPISFFQSASQSVIWSGCVCVSMRRLSLLSSQNSARSLIASYFCMFDRLLDMLLLSEIFDCTGRVLVRFPQTDGESTSKLDSEDHGYRIRRTTLSIFPRRRKTRQLQRQLRNSLLASLPACRPAIGTDTDTTLLSLS